jgi:hypothetical protein
MAIEDLDHRDANDRQRSQEQLSEEMFQDFLKRRFPSNPQRSLSELVTMKQLRSDRMVMSSRATTFEADYKASKGVNHEYAGLVRQSQDQTATMMTENDELKRELAAQQQLIDILKGRN